MMAANFGEELRLAREARGISLREISEQTRISVRYLEAIESNDYKRLPGGIFNRSFIKAYAKYVGYDEQAALEGYTRTAREQGDAVDEVSTTPYQSRVYTDGNTRSPIVTLLLTILILAVLSLGVWGAKHWYERREAARQSGDSSSTNPQSAQQQPSAPSSAPSNSSAPAPQTNAFHIQIKARGESVWVSTQLDDSKKASGFVLQADEAREFEPQQSLKIGYAPVKAKALEVNINGRPARVPQDKAEMLITKDSYEQLLQ
ncbi:MAG: helix-turn-helix domain-containing protein [Pyrinomonadaceae bacterium]|nr:helix-turn-helix domain-containing protein [Pyrinomonadaceae bacterium]